MSCQPLEEPVFSEHALWELARRGISTEEVAAVLRSPGQAWQVRPGRSLYQTRSTQADTQKAYLLRVFVDVDREPAQVVTAYRASKVEKYWRTDDARGL
jgi:hypothetical protein